MKTASDQPQAGGMSFSQLRDTASRRLTSPLVPLLVKCGITPNTLTLAGLLVNLAAAWLVATGSFLAGGIVILLSGLFDILDGALARGTRRTTSLGALLDSTSDRLSEGAVFFALAFFYLPQGRSTEVLLAFAAMVGSFLISYVRARAEGLGIDCKVGFFTRSERIVILVAGLVLNQVTIALWVLAVLSFAAALHRVIHVWRRTSGGAKRNE